MKTSDKDINRLTRTLLKEGLTEPSPDLSRLIMDRIMQEAPLEVPEVKKIKVRSDMSPFLILGLVIVYLVLAAGFILLMNQQSEYIGNTLNGIKEKLPYILTLAAIGGSLVFYSTLDKVLALRY